MDISKEFIIKPYNGGVEFVHPDRAICTDYSLNDLLKFPIHVALLDTESKIQQINESTIINSGFSSVKETIGKTIRIASKKKTADFSINHDKKVVTEKKMIILQEDFIRKDETRFQALTIKLPWYSNNKIVGVFAYAIILDKHNLAESLDLIIKTGVLSSAKTVNSPLEILSKNTPENILFSERETQCIQLLIRGKTAKMIAKSLNLSPRTVEHYIENLKIKLKVHSKYELIDKLISIHGTEDIMG